MQNYHGSCYRTLLIRVAGDVELLSNGTESWHPGLFPKQPAKLV